MVVLKTQTPSLNCSLENRRIRLAVSLARPFLVVHLSLSGFVNSERSSFYLFAVQSGDCFLSLFIVDHGDQSKAAGASCLWIDHDSGALNGAIRFKKAS